MEKKIVLAFLIAMSTPLTLAAPTTSFMTPPGPNSGVPLEDFYPFGEDVGDHVNFNGTQEPASYEEVMGEGQVKFPVYGYLCDKLVQKQQGYFHCDPVTANPPRGYDYPSMYPFSIRGVKNGVENPGSYVGIRGTNDPVLLTKANQEVKRAFHQYRNFFANYMVIATWVNMTCNDPLYCKSTYTRSNNDFTGVNTFQGILVTDGEMTFSFFYFGDIQWAWGGQFWVGHYDREDFDDAIWYNGGPHTYGDLVGVTSGDFMKNSNMGVPGKWAMRVDRPTVVEWPVPPEYVGISFCNGHGQEACTCNRGFEGGNCSDIVDWCEKPIIPTRPANEHTNPLFKDACQPHGNCTSDPIVGAKCICNSETPFVGMFCDQADMALKTCLRFAPAHGTAAGRDALEKYPIGCDWMNTPEKEWSCLPNSLSCLDTELSPYCEIPLGWCLPKNEVEEIIASTTPQPTTVAPPPTTEPTTAAP